MSNRLIGIRAKIERSKHHINDLERRLHTFRESRPYRLISEPDADARQQLCKVRVHAAIPPELAVVAGEIVHQLRSSLDHLAWQLWDKNGRVKLREDKVYFPVYEADDKYNAERPNKVEGVFAPAAVRILDDLKPYAAGNDLLWKLHKLNNIDKHRHLSVVACALESVGLLISGAGFNPPENAARFDMLKPQSAGDELRVIEDGAVVCAYGSFTPPGCLPVSNVDMNLQAIFEIVFGEPRVVRGEPVLHLLHQLTGLTDGIVSLFEPLLL